MGLGQILEHHNVFQWDGAVAAATAAVAWHAVCLYPYTDARSVIEPVIEQWLLHNSDCKIWKWFYHVTIELTNQLL